MGIASGEPFLVQADEPIYHTTRDYDEVYTDPEWTGGIVRRLRRTPESSLRSWSFLINMIERSRALRRVDVKAMKLNCHDFWQDKKVHWSSFLTSNHGGVCLVSAPGDTREGSLRALMTRVAQELPGPTIQGVYHKFFRRTPLTRGELLSLLEDPLFIL